MRDEYFQANQGYEDDIEVRVARLGIEAQQFLRSNLGKELIKAAEAEIEAGYKALAIVDPDSPSDVRHQQFQIAVARFLPEWLSYVIQQGAEAERVIESEEYDQ